MTAVFPRFAWIRLHLVDNTALFGGVEAGENVDEGVEVEDGEVGGAGDEGNYDD